MMARTLRRTTAVIGGLVTSTLATLGSDIESFHIEPLAPFLVRISLRIGRGGQHGPSHLPPLDLVDEDDVLRVQVHA